MNTLPNELLSEVILDATDVEAELDSNLDDHFRVPLQTDMEEMLKAAMLTRKALVQVSKRFWDLATPALYRSVIITHPHTINLLFKTIMGERSFLFRHRVRRFHLSIRHDLREYWWDVAPGTAKLMKYLPNLKIYCAMGRLHPNSPLLFTPLDPATSFPHLEAVEHSVYYHHSTIRAPISISNLLHSSPNLRVFLLPDYLGSNPNSDTYAFKSLRGCYVDDLTNIIPSNSSIDPNLEDTNQQTLSSQPPFLHLRSLSFWGHKHPKIDRNLALYITLLDLSPRWGMEMDVLDLSQFPRLRTLVMHPAPEWWKFKFSDDHDELREVGIRSETHKRWYPVVDWKDIRTVVEHVLGLPAPIQRLRFLGFDFCRVLVGLELYQSILGWEETLEEQGISLEGPNGLPLVEFLASLS